MSAPGFTTNGSFSLSILRAGYSMTAIVASCDDLSSAPDLLGQGTLPAIADDAVTPVLQLPPGFTFPFFRMPVSHYSVTMNGFAQLFTAGIGMGNNSFSNTALPTAFAPNGMIAPFWDDLAPIIGQTHVRSAERGAAPNRVFTLQWFDATFLTGGPERLRFQAKLFETTGVIEFHYCELQLNGGSMDDLTGATSTIGLENAFGTEAVQKSFNTPNSISSGSGLRFVPQ